MKSIDPVSPLEEIIPEQPAQAQQTPPQAIDLQQTNVVQSPLESVQTQAPTPVTPATVYPTPLTYQERAEKLSSNNESAPKQSGISVSQYGIPLIAGVYVLSSIWNVIKAMATQGTMSAFGVNKSFLTGYGEGTIWTGLILSLIQYIILLIALYKILQSSKLGLAIVTGASIVLLPQLIVLYVTFGSNISLILKRTESFVWLIGTILLTILLILAWTKERKYYY